MRGQVHLLPFELMKADSARFAAELAAVLGDSPAEILRLLNAPENRQSHKIRVIETQRRLYETFRWIDLEQPERLVEEGRAVLAEAGIEVGSEIMIALEAALGEALEEGWDRKAWAGRLRRIALRMPADALLARPVLPTSEADKVRHITKRALQHLQEDFGFDLISFGLSYDG